jgi:hypothetical protein
VWRSKSTAVHAIKSTYEVTEWQGYDAIYIASTLGLDTLGLDASETAVEIASQ